MEAGLGERGLLFDRRHYNTYDGYIYYIYIYIILNNNFLLFAQRLLF